MYMSVSERVICGEIQLFPQRMRPQIGLYFAVLRPYSRQKKIVNLIEF